ncbi:MAG TPA: sigma-70 family RNA polymerase sigma factor [Ktedonobacteraceae bacterium]|jgi:RNA polymerase sigma-70 factor (ECF subfamily)|nr:sigma-70 family RNA polymerase sigma factor [Ktedonobacteraceae bacterium]
MQQQKRGNGQDHFTGHTLFERYGQSIFSYIRLHVASREDAEDLTLEVFTAALEHGDLVGLSPEAQLAWLRRVAHNKLIDTYRRQARRPAVSLDAAMDALYEDEEQAPEQVAIRREELARLREAIGKLSPLQQQILQLRYGQGMRFAEIAVLLDKREDAVRQMLSRTLTLLGTIYSSR